MRPTAAAPSRAAANVGDGGAAPSENTDLRTADDDDDNALARGVAAPNTPCILLRPADMTRMCSAGDEYSLRPRSCARTLRCCSALLAARQYSEKRTYAM